MFKLFSLKTFIIFDATGVHLRRIADFRFQNNPNFKNHETNRLQPIRLNLILSRPEIPLAKADTLRRDLDQFIVVDICNARL